MDAVDNLTLELWGLERLLNISELAAYLRVPVSTLYEWRTKGQAPLAHRYGEGRTVRIARREWSMSGWVTALVEVPQS